MRRPAAAFALLLAAAATAQETAPTRPGPLLSAPGRTPADFVQAAGGDLTLGDAPVRFWGVALRKMPPEFAPPDEEEPPDGEPHALALPDGPPPETPAGAFLGRLSTAGVNLLRVEIPSPDTSSSKGDMAAIDVLLGLCRERGLRLWLGASDALGSASADSVGILDDPASEEEWAEAFENWPEHRLALNGSVAVAWDPRLELLAVQRLRERVQHFNPTTGLRWADDPSVALWELDGLDDWHGRMDSGASDGLPEISLRFLDMHRRIWMGERFPPDELPESLDPDQEREFRDALWTDHKKRIDDKFRFFGQSTRRSPVAWRETALPAQRFDGSGCSILFAPLAAFVENGFAAGWCRRIASGGDTVAALRLWIGSSDLDENEKPDIPWFVLAASHGVDVLVWDGIMPTNAVPGAFHAAFAAASELFRAGFDGSAFAPQTGEDNAACTIRAKQATWDRAICTPSTPLPVGGNESLLLSPVRDATPVAVAYLRFAPDRRTAYLASNAPLVLEIRPETAESERFWKAPSFVFDAVDYSGASLLHERVEEFPARIELPRGTFRIDITAK